MKVLAKKLIKKYSILNGTKHFSSDVVKFKYYLYQIRKQEINF